MSFNPEVSNIKLKEENGKETVISSIPEIEKQLKKLKAIAVSINGQLCDLNMVKQATDTDTFEAVTFDSEAGRDIYRHSTSHVMAHAVKKLFPTAKLAIGPSIHDGFYYDFDMEKAFTPEDLIAIEKEMQKLIKKDSPFVRKDMSRDEALRLFKDMGDIYKVELLNEITDDNVSVYEEDGFLDLCRGPHLVSTGKIAAFKLLSIAGAYWRGNEKNKMLQRIYGTSFNNPGELKEYLDLLEEIKKRDHRRLGKELDLFSINDEIGSGLVLWHPNGAVIRKTIEDLWRDEHIKANYKLLYTPHIARLELWNRSGHLDYYKENMYSPMEIEGVDYELKPMNCPFHLAIYKSSLRSYRDLPIRYAELGTVYRFERSGVLHGLMRVRGFTQDDAHIFCTDDQIEDEILKILDFTIFILKTFGFEKYDIYLSTRPEKFVGTEEHWQRSTEALKKALETKGLEFMVDPGEGVFYGPKIDIKVKDSLGRAWQCSTIQLDFNNPERFDISYRGADGREHRPIMIHRALMGSLERFFGILIEHYAGAFPVWLAPVQISVLTIAERHSEYAGEIFAKLKQKGIRAELDSDSEKIGNKIRKSSIRKIPFSVIIGDKEIAENSLMVRVRSGENLGPFDQDGLISFLEEKINSRE
ncbi:MAG: threonine--tRNA ligase [Nitrospirae bacterium GWC2_42_7]|nr:MAG: threonine--tRNA ligase [Nitrospirae bacterium GWC2_42_7]